MSFTITESGEVAFSSLANQRIHPEVKRNREEFVKAIRAMSETRHLRFSYYTREDSYNEETGSIEFTPHTPGCSMCVNGVALVGLGIDEDYDSSDGHQAMCRSLGVDSMFFWEIDRKNMSKDAGDTPSFTEMADEVEAMFIEYHDWISAVNAPVYTFDANRCE